MTPLALLLAASALSAPVSKDDKLDFTWKLKKADVLYVTLETDADARLKPPPQIALAVIRETQKTLAVWKVTVAAADADGVVLGLEAVSFADASVWNTGKVGEPKAVADAAGKTLTLTFDPAFRLSKVADGEAWDKLRAKQPQGSGMPTAKGVGLVFEYMLQVVPGGLQGKEWQRKEEVLDKEAKTADTWTRRAKVTGVKDGVATVTTETDLDGQQEDNGRSLFVPFERKAEKCPGTLTFDTATGRLVRFEETLTVTGLSGAKDQGVRYDGTTKTVAMLSAEPPKGR